MWNSAKVHDDEREDFLALCKSNGIDGSSLMLGALEQVPLEPGPIARRVVVARGTKKVEFEAGSGTDWIQPAIDAVRAGALDE